MSPTEKSEFTPVDFQLRAAGTGAQTNPQRSGKHTRGFLPHVKSEGASYFVTFRLEGTLPKNVILALQCKKAAKIRESKIRSDGKPAENHSIQRAYFRAMEAALDTHNGALSDPRVARAVGDALQFFHGERYRLDAWVVMPTHVHAVVWPAPGHTLSQILHTWKRFSAREANKILDRANERFWQSESYDHWIPKSG